MEQASNSETYNMEYSKICKCSNDSNRCHWARLDNVPECRARTHLGKAPRIINGQTAVAHSKPYMVSISVKSKGGGGGKDSFRKIQLGALPPNLYNLDMSGNYYFNQDLAGILPPNLKILKLSYLFNQKLKKNDLPESLIYLKFGEHFNKPIKKFFDTNFKFNFRIIP